MACGPSVPHRPSVGFPAAAGNELWLFGYVRLELRTLLHDAFLLVEALRIAAAKGAVRVCTVYVYFGWFAGRLRRHFNVMS